LFPAIALNAAAFYMVQTNTPQSAELAADLLWIKQQALSGLMQYIVHGKRNTARLSPPSTVRSDTSNERRGSNPSSSEQDEQANHEITVCATQAPTPSPPSLPPPNPHPYITDDIIAATTKLAAFEAIYGDPNAYHIHMAAVARMIHARGGLATLRLNGFLARLVVFVDTNCAAIMGRNGRLHLTEYGHSASFPRRQALFRADMVQSMTYCGGGGVELLADKQYTENLAARLPKEVLSQA
jgi:hypothetical protein